MSESHIPREGATRYVLLGVLDQLGSASGYEIRSHILQSVGHFWHESFGQIYPELRRLASESFIAPTGGGTAGARGRRRYKLRASGRRLLQEWLARPAAHERMRSEYLLKLFFGRTGGIETSRSHAVAAEHRHGELQSRLRAVAHAVAAEDAESPDLVYSLATLRHGLLVSAARRRAAEESLQLLKAHERGGNRAVLTMWRTFERTKELE
jgi:DNA-binding PadR family transcriptional regulator